MRSLGLVALLALFGLVLGSSSAHAATDGVPVPRNKARSASAKRRKAYPSRVAYTPSRPSNDLSVAPVPSDVYASSTPVKTPPLAASLSPKEESAPKRFMNIRLHPVHLLYMATQKDTLASARGDIDFMLGDKVTLGASVIYHQTSEQDTAALATGVGQTVDMSLLEVGLLSNLYLTGTSSTGGFILRPHVYWIDAHGSKDNNTPNGIASTGAKNGARAGAEFIYQVILPVGFNLEIGGGFTYHLVPYAVDYPAPGLTRSEPDNRFVPTVSAGVGWAF